MKTTSKRLFCLLGSLSILGSSSLSASDYYDDNEAQASTKSVHAIPAAQYPVGDNLTFFIDAAYTFWAPYQEGMNLFILGGHIDVPKGNVIDPKMSAVSGFKVGFGANTQHDGWRGAINYTWFSYNPRTRDSNLKTDAAIVTPDAYLNLWDNGATQNTRYAESRFKTFFNRVDLIIDRSFFTGQNIAFRPWGGLLAAWDYQRLEFSSSPDALDFVVASANSTVNYNLKQDWWGIGVYSGVESTYYFTKEFGVYLSMGGALLLCDHSNTHVETGYNTTLTTDWNGNNNFNAVEPMVENSLGVCYDGEFPEWAIKVFLAWEMQTYFFHNGFLPQVPNIGSAAIYTSRGNFSMQGLTAGIRISF